MSKLVRKTIVSLFVLINSGITLIGSDSISFGEYKVGFQIREVVDVERNNKLISVCTWFPAIIHDSSLSTTVEDYLNTDFSSKIQGEEWKPILDKKMNSYLNCSAISDSFPLVVLGQGYGFEEIASLAHLAEYIASQGYIVSTCPLQIQKNDNGKRFTVDDLESQMLDMKILIKKTMEEFNVNAFIGLIGFDFGGLSASLLSMHSENIDCLISLDAGLIFQHNLEFMKESKYYNPEKLQIPILQITRFSEENESMGIVEDFSFFKASPNSTKIILRFSNIKHSAFTSYSLMGFENYGSKKIYPFDVEVNVAIPIMYAYIKHYLNAHLKNEENSIDFINKSGKEHSLKLPVSIEFQ